MLMDRGAPFRRKNISNVAVSVFLGAAIFLGGFFSHAQAGLASLYVITVLLLPETMSKKGITAVYVTCAALTAYVFIPSHDIGLVAQIVFLFINILMYIYIAYCFFWRKNHKKTIELLIHSLKDTQDVIIVRNESDVIVYWSLGAEALYGWSALEAKGQVADILLKTIFPVSKTVRNAILLREDKWEGELFQTSKDCSPVVVLSRWLLQRDVHGAVFATVEANIDITLQRNLQDNVQQSSLQFDDDFRTVMLAQMTSSIAHDLSQPISALTIGSEASLRWLRSDVCNIDEARSAVESVIANARRAGEVITRVRQLAERETVTWEKISPNALIKHALWATQDTLVRHQAALELSLADGLPEVIGNRKLLDKVFADLLAHVVEILPSRLSGSRLVGETKMRVNYFGTSEILLDMGTRAAVDSFDRLALEFSDASELANDMIGSKLSVCRYVIEAHSWRIDAVSTPSHGEAFRIKIPVQKDTRLDVE